MRDRRAPTWTFLVAVLLALGIAGPARAERGYKRKRLRATLTFTVRHRPATGAPQTRSFSHNATLRVQRKRR
jgi:hypothetical protein